MSDLAVAAACAALVAALCCLGPELIAWLPEPKLESDAAEKTPYAELGARPHLRLKLAIAGAVVGALVGATLTGEAIIATWIYLGAIGTILAYVDAQTRLLPTRLIAPSYGIIVVLVAVAAWLDDSTSDLIRSGWGWLAMGGFYFVMWFVYPKGLGYGDVRLSGLLGLALGYVGWGALATGMYAGFLLGGIGGGLLALTKIVDRKHYPFGPFMLLGALVGLIWGQAVADWYASF